MFYLALMNIIITGASRGIGKAIAERFAPEGSMIILNARDKSTLEKTAGELKQKTKANILTYAADLSVETEASAFTNWCLGQCIPDVVINNAGMFLPGSIHNEEPGTLQKMIEVNLYSAYYLTRGLLPEMMKKKSGHIFNICSIASLQAYENGGSYSISKFALSGFSKNLREELKPYNIKVTTVYPGAVYTDSWSGSGVDPKRIMETKDIADMIYAAAHLSPQACVEEIVLRPQLGDL
jgi:short-subunit dehydrogenase